MDAELEFAIQPNTTGKQLFDQVIFILLQLNLEVTTNPGWSLEKWAGANFGDVCFPSPFDLRRITAINWIDLEIKRKCTLCPSTTNFGLCKL